MTREFWYSGLLTLRQEQQLDCTPTGDPLTVDEDGAVAGEIPAGCFGIVIDGTRDSISHGDVVSQTVRAVKEIRDQLDEPFGRYVRDIAKSDLGMPGSGDSAVEDESSDIDDDGRTRNGPPDHANANGRDRPDSTDEDESAAGASDHGPPDHVKAHGRDK